MHLNTLETDPTVMTVTLGFEVLERYARFSLYNSPYPAHDDGCAIDLYPGTLRDGRTTIAPSPVSGTVLETRQVRAPPKPYAAEHDYLILLECSGPPALEGLIARILHVEASVEAGDTVVMGESLGTLVRAGFFAPWVDNHLHVGFREPGQHLHRATGSRRLELGFPVQPLEWDGTGTVVQTGQTYAVLDAPTHPAPGSTFVGIGCDLGSGVDAGGGEADDGTPGRGVLDGGLPHYEGGGLIGGVDGPVSLNGDRIGVARNRTIAWDDVTVIANGVPITGLSFFCARDAAFGVKLICPELSLARGTDVKVHIR